MKEIRIKRSMYKAMIENNKNHGNVQERIDFPFVTIQNGKLEDLILKKNDKGDYDQALFPENPSKKSIYADIDLLSHC